VGCLSGVGMTVVAQFVGPRRRPLSHPAVNRTEVRTNRKFSLPKDRDQCENNRQANDENYDDAIAGSAVGVSSNPAGHCRRLYSLVKWFLLALVPAVLYTPSNSPPQRASPMAIAEGGGGDGLGGGPFKRNPCTDISRTFCTKVVQCHLRSFAEGSCFQGEEWRALRDSNSRPSGS
jgi:hypothetical protein